MAARPRNARSDAAILNAAVSLLRERGYAGLTLDEVARRADVGKSSLYSRFPDRAALAAAAVASMQRDLPPPTGEVRADLIAYLRAIQRDLGALGLGVVSTRRQCVTSSYCAGSTSPSPTSWRGADPPAG